MPSTVSERLLELLETAGVDVVFGIAGTQTIPLLGAFERRGRPRFVSARNEQGAAYMATAYARATGRPGVLVTSTGPGALNTFTGLAEARYSSLPLLHITSFADTGDFSGGIHETPYQTRLLETVGIATCRAEAEDIDGAFWRAWHVCRGTPTGPVSLELNARVWNKRARDQAGIGAKTANESLRKNAGNESEANAQLALLLDAARAAKSPVLYIGGGALLSGASDLVVRLAELLDAPIVTSSQGKAVSDWGHPLYVGPWGADPAAHELFKASDLAIIVGSKLSALSTLHWQMPLPEKSFRIDPQAAPHGKYTRVVNIRADASEACRRLVAELKRKNCGSTARVAGVVQRVFAAARARAPIEMRYLAALEAALPDHSAFALDMNKASFWIMKYLRMGHGSVQSFPSYLNMGSALPGAIGLAEAGRPSVLASIGDGGFQMGMTELGLLAQAGYPVSLLVFNDGKYGLLKDNGVPDIVRGATSLGIDLRNPDFEALARAFDMDYARVREPEDLSSLLANVTTPRIIESRFEFSRHW